MGTSTRPVLFTLPTTEKTFVPLLPSVPILEYQSAPLEMMTGTLFQVSTLLRLLGLSQRPLSVVWIYLALGSPTFPSMEAIRAVDSPQTKAPPPRNRSTWKEKPESKIFSPRSPASSA